MKRLSLLLTLIALSRVSVAQTVKIKEVDDTWANTIVNKIMVDDSTLYVCTSLEVYRYNKMTDSLELMKDLRGDCPAPAYDFASTYFIHDHKLFYYICDGYYGKLKYLDLLANEVIELPYFFGFYAPGDFKLTGAFKNSILLSIKSPSNVSLYSLDYVLMDTTNLIKTQSPSHFKIAYIGQDKFYVSIYKSSQTRFFISDASPVGTYEVIPTTPFPALGSVKTETSDIFLYTSNGHIGFWNTNTEEVSSLNNIPEITNTPVYFGALEDPNDGSINHYFTVRNNSSTKIDIWVSDKSYQGTAKVASLDCSDCASSKASGFVRLSDRIYFSFNDSWSDRELWCSDLSFDSIYKIDIDPLYGSDAYFLHVFNNQLYLSANYPYVGSTVMLSDGTPAGTVPVCDLDSYNRPYDFTELDDQLFFLAIKTQNSKGISLWRTDGIPAISYTTELKSNNNIAIFPNPASREIRIETGAKQEQNMTICIYDNTGNLMLKVNGAAGDETLDVSQITPGVYFIHCFSENTSRFGKLVVAR